MLGQHLQLLSYRCGAECLSLSQAGHAGVWVSGQEASVVMMGVSVKGCANDGMYALRGAAVKATQCEFSENAEAGVYMNGGSKGFFTDCSIHDNGMNGVFAEGESTLVELHGSEQMKIHHNEGHGLNSFNYATINIYIPLQPITALVHDNGGDDLTTVSGGKIQSQLSSSSLELTVIHPIAQ